MLQSEKEGPGPGLLEIARSLEPLIRRHEDELERVRRLPDELVDALYDRGVFRAFTPRASTVIRAPHPQVGG